MWMDKNWLKMNQSKTEFIIFGSRQQVNKCVSDSLDVNGVRVPCSDQIKYLGASLDSLLNFKNHIKAQCRKAMGNVIKLKYIRNYLTVDACKVLASGMILSHIDYCNAILAGLPKCDIDKLHRVQSMAAKIILKRGKYMTVLASLFQIYIGYQLVHKRIDFKVLTLVYKCINQMAPEYLMNKLIFHNAVRSLRSDSMFETLVVPRTKRKTFADRAFSFYWPSKWNELPNNIKEANTLDVFKSKLKTYMF